MSSNDRHSGGKKGPQNEVVNGYQVGAEIGKGSFANVYKGVILKSSTPVAIKSVLRSKLKNKKLLENLEIEIQILKTLVHPHIVSLIDCQQSSNYFHIIMEYCSLGDLSYFIRKRNQLTKSHPLISQIFVKYPSPDNSNGLNKVITIHFLKQLASALQFLRSKNLVHRDIKPQNLLLCYPTHSKQEFIDKKYTGNYDLPILKIADFGFARFLPNQSLAETLCGSPLYMAPEILRYEKYNAKADLWSVGAVLYEMSVGRPPFRANNHVELLKKIENARDNITFPENIEIDEDIKRLICGLLKLKSIERISFNEFFNDRLVLSDINEYINDSETLDHSSIDENLFISEYLPGNANTNKVTPIEKTVSNANKAEQQRKASDDGSTTASQEPRLPSQFDKNKFDQQLPSPKAQSPVPKGREEYRRKLSLLKQQLEQHSFRQQNMNAKIQEAEESRQVNNEQQRDLHRQRQQEQQYQEQLRHQREELLQKQGQEKQQSREHILQAQQAPKQLTGQGQQAHQEQHQQQNTAAQQLDQQRQQGQSSNLSGRLKSSSNTLGSLKSKSNATELLNERDYVVVEKKSVEVNALADELANFGINNNTSNAGANTNKQNVKKDVTPQEKRHRSSSSSQKRPSFGDRRFSISLAPSNALSKALVIASTRLFGNNTYLSKDAVLNPMPHGVTKETVERPSAGTSGAPGGYSPPNAPRTFDNNNNNNAANTANAYAQGAYPGSVNTSDANVVGNPNELLGNLILQLESLAAKAHAVNLFAQVKYFQLIPSTPSSTSAIADDSDDEDSALQAEKTAHLPPIAIKSISEEGLSLYIKTLSLLAKAMNLTSEWWYSEENGTIKSGGGEFYPTNSSDYDPALTARLNSLVQWVREAFNECLDRADFIRLKLNEANQRLGLGFGNDEDALNTKVIAEKLIFDRALEISRNAAVNELVGEDLLGCELAYSTSIWMLEAILDAPDKPGLNNVNNRQTGVNVSNTVMDNFGEDEVNLDVEDKAMVQKFIVSIGNRLNVLRKKIEIINSGGAQK